MSKNETSTELLTIVTLTPFKTGSITGKGKVKEGYLDLISLPMDVIYNINEDQDNDNGLNPLHDKEFESIILDFTRLEQHLAKQEEVENMLFILRNNSVLKWKNFFFVGNINLIKKLFKVDLDKDKFFKSIEDARNELHF